MAGYRWNSRRTAGKLRKQWRRRAVLRSAGRGGSVLRLGLFAMLGAELLVGVHQEVQSHPDRVRLIRMEEEYCLEWEQVPDTVYGIRLDPKHFEIQFYQQKYLQ